MLVKDICSRITDGSHNPPQGISQSPFIMLSSKNIFDDNITLDEPRFLNKEDFERENKRTNVNVGDVLLTIVGTVGRTAVVTSNLPPITLQRSVAVLHPNRDVCIERYLMYALQGKRTYIEGTAKGVAQKGIYLKEVEKIDLPVPSIEVQKQIVETLDNVTSIIKHRKQQLAKFDELVKARFVEMFGDYRVNDKGFDCRKGSDLFKFSSGKFLPDEKRFEIGIPVYGGNGIAWYTNETLVDYPTVIIGRVGAHCGNVHAVTTPVWITDNAIYIKEQKTNAYTLEFLTELMRMMDFYQYADFSGQPKITQKPLETLEYIMPPIELQNEYTTFVEQVDKSKLAVQKALDEAQTLFDSLMQQYFG